MAHSLHLKTKARREAHTDASVAVNIPVRSNETVDQNDNITDDDSESVVRATSPSTQRHGEFEGNPGIYTQQPLRRTRQQADGRRESLDGLVSSIEDKTDTIVYTMEWRRAVLRCQEDSRVCQNREGRWRAELDAKILKIRQHYDEQEKALERELATLERQYKWTIMKLERAGRVKMSIIWSMDVMRNRITSRPSVARELDDVDQSCRSKSSEA